MSGISLGLVVELLVAILLVVTIAYCVVVHAKLKWLKSDQAKLIKVIGELNTATANAEHAVAALSTISSGADKAVEGQIERSRDVTAQLSGAVAEAEHFLAKIARIVQANQIRMPATRPAAQPALLPPQMVRPAVRAKDVGLGRLNAMRQVQPSDKEVA